jgi:hypothetical protein
MLPILKILSMTALYQIVCEPETFTFKIKTKGKPDRWVDIPLRLLLFK